jgi:NagD protein
MIGDRMDTDVISGLEAGLRSILVLTGSTGEHEVERFPYRPTRIVESVADVIPLIEATGPADDSPPANLDESLQLG